jgi:thioesterase domain-containing protein/acyl carrier protein
LTAPITYAQVRTGLRPHVARSLADDFDLSSLRALVSGGESNVVDTCAKLSVQLQSYGAPGSFIRPGFGMTETCAGSIYNTLDCPEYDLSQGTEFCSLGECIPGIQMRIMQPDGIESSANEIGLLEVSGPVVFSGYYHDENSTQQAFKSPRWFSTGDLGLLDSNGRLRLTGREKDTIVINGYVSYHESPSGASIPVFILVLRICSELRLYRVNFYSQAIEAAIEEAAVPGVTPSYTAVFAFRPKDSATECLCVAYLRTPTEIDADGSARTTIEISNAVVKYCGTRPSQMIALPASLLQKSSLGKLSRSNIRRAFENGDYNEYIVNNLELVPQLLDVCEPGGINTQRIILNHLYTLLGVSFGDSVTTSDICSLGVSSIDLLKLQARLQGHLKVEIPITTFLSTSSVQDLGQCIDALRKKKEYDPIAILQAAGSKTPLFIIHPGMGDVLVFMNLARYITDRPVYALRARGFDGEEIFSSMDEMITVYYAAIKRMQPEGRYAIVGYLFGSIVAFELTKMMEANGDVVQFLATIDQPPHLKLRAAMYDWYQTVVTISFFMGLINEDYAYASLPMLRQKSHEEVIDHIRGLADPVLLEQIGMSRERLQNWANLAYQFKVIARQYDPAGLVAKMHVFYTKARTTATKVQSEQQWFDEHISKWRDFASHVAFHQIRGKHTTSISPPNVLGFQKLLKSIMEENGL